MAYQSLCENLLLSLSRHNPQEARDFIRVFDNCGADYVQPFEFEVVDPIE